MVCPPLFSSNRSSKDSKMSMLGWWMVHTMVRPVLTMLRTVLITMAAALASRPVTAHTLRHRGCRNFCEQHFSLQSVVAQDPQLSSAQLPHGTLLEGVVSRLENEFIMAAKTSNDFSLTKTVCSCKWSSDSSSDSQVGAGVSNLRLVRP